MGYSAVMVYSIKGEFIGYGVKGNEFKLQTTNLYREDEQDKLNEQLARLNTDFDLRKTWPHPQDPEVLAIVDDERFMPIEHIEAEVVDDERSHYVWKTEPATDERGEYIYDTIGQVQMVQGTELDEDASVIRYRIGKVPKNPSDVLWRLKAASEIVARRRAGL